VSGVAAAAAAAAAWFCELSERCLDFFCFLALLLTFLAIAASTSAEGQPRGRMPLRSQCVKVPTDCP
jgi:hypothetical protein